jgi:hypothetical protein
MRPVTCCPIAALTWLMALHRDQEQRSQRGQASSVARAWRDCGPGLRQVLRFTALACLVGFFHPGLAPLIANELLGSSPQALGYSPACSRPEVSVGCDPAAQVPAAQPPAGPVAREPVPWSPPWPSWAWRRPPARP